MESEINNGNLLITGGSGVLGGYIISLLREEFDIVVADIVRPKYDVKYVKVDLTKPFTLSQDFEICIHLAAYVGGIQYFTRYPVKNIRDNPRMTTNMFDAAINSKTNHIIYTSSSRVYENQTEFPTTEESTSYSPPPSSPYGMSKLVGEYICKAYHEEFGINYTILRPSNLYGPLETPDPEYAHVIPELIRKVLSGNSQIEIYGDGQQTRNFTHGKDAAKAYKLSIKNKNATNETFNLSGNEEFKIIQVLELVWDMTRNREKLRVKQLPSLPYDTRRVFLSNKKLRERLDWEPVIGLKEGLFETIESLRKISYA